MNKIAFVTWIAVNMWIGGCTYGMDVRPDATGMQNDSKLSPLKKTRKEYEVADTNSFWQSQCGMALLKIFRCPPTHNELLSFVEVITSKIPDLCVGRSEKRLQKSLFSFIENNWDLLEPHLKFVCIEYAEQDLGGGLVKKSGS